MLRRTLFRYAAAACIGFASVIDLSPSELSPPENDEDGVYVFVGSSDNRFNNPDSWNLGEVPRRGHVIIPNGSNVIFESWLDLGRYKSVTITGSRLHNFECINDPTEPFLTLHTEQTNG